MASDLNLNEANHDELVGGCSLWGRNGVRPAYQPLEQSFKTDIAIIGGGITGALAAEHLTARGFSVVVIDREQPGFGSTAASTAMLQWEIDRTLGELEALYGFERAAGIYRRSGACVAGLAKLIAAHGITCGFQPRNTLYLANNHEGARELMEERQLRRRAGLPGHYLEHPDLLTQYEFDRDAAILSPGSAEADPVLLTWALLQIAFSRGARLLNASVTSLHSEGGHVTAETNGAHVIEARHVVLATGYSMPGLDMPKLHRTSSRDHQASAARWRVPNWNWCDAASACCSGKTAIPISMCAPPQTTVSSPAARTTTPPIPKSATGSCRERLWRSGKS